LRLSIPNGRQIQVLLLFDNLAFRAHKQDIDADYFEAIKSLKMRLNI